MRLSPLHNVLRYYCNHAYDRPDRPSCGGGIGGLHRSRIRLCSCGPLSYARQRRRLWLLLPVPSPRKLTRTRAPKTPTPSCPRAPAFLLVRNVAQRSGTRNYSVNRRGWAPSWWQGFGNDIWGRACSLFASQRRRARACLQVCRQGAQSRRTLARPHTHADTSAHASHAEDIEPSCSGPGFRHLRLFCCPAT